MRRLRGLARRLSRRVTAAGLAVALFALAAGFAAGAGYVMAISDREPAEAPAAAPSPDPTLLDLLGIDLAGRAFLGNAEASVTVIELTDYECPFCRRHRQQVLSDLLAEYGDRIRYYVLNFPLTSIHPNAFIAAEAAECANDQGMFWEYGDAIFSSNAAPVPEELLAIAENLELDMAQFTQCMNSRSKRGLVALDRQAGQRLGVTGTPTFFINARQLTGARPLSVFRSAIDSELAATGG